METQLAGPTLGGKAVLQTNWIQRSGLFIAFLICALAIHFFGSNFFAIFPTNNNLAYNVLISAAFLVAALLFKRSERMNRYWQSALAFFVASVPYPITLIFGRWTGTVLSWFNVTVTMSEGQAIAKVYGTLLVAIPILLLIKLSGADLGSIYLKRGNLKWSLSIGALVWFNVGTSAFLFFATRFTGPDRLVAAVVWGLVFSFANGLLEELWFRGIFLRHFEPVLGLGGSILLTSIIFALVHSFSSYLPPIVLPFYVANTLTLGLACGYLIMKTDSLWGAVLVHAATDLFLFIAVLSNA